MDWWVGVATLCVFVALVIAASGMRRSVDRFDDDLEADDLRRADDGLDGQAGGGPSLGPWGPVG